MSRALFTTVAACSLLLCTAAIVMWVRSYSVGEVWGIPRPYMDIASEWGTFVVYFAEGRGSRFGYWAGEPDRVETASERPESYRSLFDFAGISYGVAIDPPEPGYRNAIFTCPHWVVIVLSAVAPVSWIAAYVRRRRAIGRQLDGGEVEVETARNTDNACPQRVSNRAGRSGRLRRWAFNVAGVLSLILLLLVLVMYVRSVTRLDQASLPGSSNVDVQSNRGALRVIRQKGSWGARDWSFATVPAQMQTAVRDWDGVERIYLDFAGIEHATGTLWETPTTITSIPYWLVVLMLSVLPACWIRQKWICHRGAVRRRRGLCERCGYSLKAIDTVACPECGHGGVE